MHPVVYAMYVLGRGVRPLISRKGQFLPLMHSAHELDTYRGKSVVMWTSHLALTPIPTWNLAKGKSHYYAVEPDLLNVPWLVRVDQHPQFVNDAFVNDEKDPMFTYGISHVHFHRRVALTSSFFNNGVVKMSIPTPEELQWLSHNSKIGH